MHLWKLELIVFVQYCCLFLQWMRHYSLSKLKLDLNSIVGSAECSHAKGKVSSLGQSVPAR